MSQKSALLWPGVWLGLCLALLAIAPSVSRAAAGAAYAEVQLDEQAALAATGGQPVTGRVFLFVSQRSAKEPRFGPDWFSPEPFFRIDVHDFQPGQVVRVDDQATGFPDLFSRIPRGQYRVQALLDHSLDSQHYAHAPGNLHSQVYSWRHDPASPRPFRLVLNQAIGPRTFEEKPWLKELRFASKLLSEFHGREVLHQAAIVLPDGYDRQPQRHYPVIYSVPGFGGTHYDSARSYAAAPPRAEPGETDFIRVLLSGDCAWGHHVFADSDCNGPRGAALVEEVIPYVDANFRTVAAATARFVAGHSSGGWSSLWLQVSYPQTFGGVWSTAPDPVDFRDWQQVNLYARPPLSLYFDERGQPRPIARSGTTPILWYQSFAKMDDVLGRGGQLRSFEAVFSPLDETGEPRRLWDRRTGQVDSEIAAAWEPYDIRLKLERNWPELGPLLQGKLHILTGEIDTFYLEGAVRKLAASLKALGSDAEVIVVPGKDHRDLLTPDLQQRIRQQMTASYRRHHSP